MFIRLARERIFAAHSLSVCVCNSEVVFPFHHSLAGTSATQRTGILWGAFGSSFPHDKSVGSPGSFSICVTQKRTTECIGLVSLHSVSQGYQSAHALAWKGRSQGSWAVWTSSEEPNSD